MPVRRSDRAGSGAAPDCAACKVRKTCFFVSCLEPDLASQFTRARVGARYRKRQFLFQEGLPAVGMYVVCSGLVKVHQSDGSGHELTINIAGPGEIVGHIPVLGRMAYNAAAETIEPSVLSFIPDSVFLSLVDKSKPLNRRLIKDLATYVSQVSLIARDVMMKSSRQRVRELLILLATKYGKSERGRTVIDLRLTRQDMGNLVGLAQETVVRTLTRLEKEGVLKIDGARITIPDLGTLQGLA